MTPIALLRPLSCLALTVSCLLSFLGVESQAKSPDLSAAVAVPAPQNLGEMLENLGRIYSDKSNPIVQEFWLLGRYHGQQHWTDGNNGQYEESFENRRLRMGFQGRFFNKLTLHAQMVSGTDLDPFYNGFTELWAQWSFSDALNFTVGQQKHRFTHDRNVSSRYINYLERSMLTNMFALDYTPAVTISGKIGSFNYYTGVFSNATGPSMGNSFTKFNSGWSYIASATWDFGKKLGTDASALNLCYLYSDLDAQATNMNRFVNGLSAAFMVTDGSNVSVSANKFDRNPRYLVNSFDNAEKNGLVFLRCENSSVSDNTISGVWKKRAALDIQAYDRFRVSNNSVLDSDGMGIRLEKVTNSSVIGNLVRDDRLAEKRSKEPSIAVIGGKANMIELNNLQNKLVAR